MLKRPLRATVVMIRNVQFSKIILSDSLQESRKALPLVTLSLNLSITFG